MHLKPFKIVHSWAQIYKAKKLSKPCGSKSFFGTP